MSEPLRFVLSEKEVTPLAMHVAQEIININLALSGVQIAIGVIDPQDNLRDLEFGTLMDSDTIHESVSARLTPEDEAAGIIVSEPSKEQYLRRRQDLFRILGQELQL